MNLIKNLIDKYQENNIKIINSITFLILIFLFLLLISYFKYGGIFTDDINLFYSNSFIGLFKEHINGLPLSSILTKFFVLYLPFKLNIHPADFSFMYFSFIKAGLFISFCFILTKILFFNKKINFLFPLSILFTFSAVFLILQKQAFLLIMLYDGFFRYIFPTFIFGYLLYILIKNDDKNSFKNYIWIYIIIFLCSISCELVCITILSGFLFYFVWSLFDLKDKKNLVVTLLALVITIIGFRILLSTGTFVRKLDSDLSFNYPYFLSILKLLPEYIKVYFKYAIMNHIIGLILFVSQIGILFYKNYKSKILKLILCFFAGLLLFFFSLIGAGKTFSYLPNNFWIIFPDINIMYSIILMALNFSLLNMLFRNNLVKDKMIFIIFFIATIVIFPINSKFYNQLKENYLIDFQKNSYKIEKIIRLANLKNKTAYIDKNIYEDDFNWPYYYSFTDKKVDYIYYESAFLNWLKYLNFNVTQGFIFTDAEKVQKEFEKNGGVFTDEELNNIRFTKLLDNDFVLNGKLE